MKCFATIFVSVVLSLLSTTSSSALIEIEFLAIANQANYDKYYAPSTLQAPFESTIYMAFETTNREDVTHTWGTSSRYRYLFSQSPISKLLNVGFYDKDDPLNSTFDFRQGFPLWASTNPLGLTDADEPIMPIFNWSANQNLNWVTPATYTHSISINGPATAGIGISPFSLDPVDYLMNLKEQGLEFGFNVDRYIRTGATQTTGGYVRGSTTISDIKVDGVSITYIPEPSSMILFGLVLLAIRSRLRSLHKRYAF
jgi:PEP-CTERM motif